MIDVSFPHSHGRESLKDINFYFGVRLGLSLTPPAHNYLNLGHSLTASAEVCDGFDGVDDSKSPPPGNGRRFQWTVGSAAKKKDGPGSFDTFGDNFDSDDDLEEPTFVGSTPGVTGNTAASPRDGGGTLRAARDIPR